MATLEVTIKNWTKYNGRNDVKKASWFRLNNDFYRDQKLYQFSAETKVVWIYLLCLCSECGNATVCVDTIFSEKVLGIDEIKISNAIKDLIEINLCARYVRGRGRNVDGRSRTATRQDKTLQDITNTKAAPVRAPVFAFDLIYSEYPRKEGKQKGLARLKTSIKTQAEFEKLSLSVKNYAAYCKSSKLEARYIKQFSTFVGCWEDWVIPPLDAQKTGIRSMSELLEESNESV